MMNQSENIANQTEGMSQNESMSQTEGMNQQNNLKRCQGNNHGADSNMTILFIIASLLVLFAVLFWAAHDPNDPQDPQDAPAYEATIQTLTRNGIEVELHSEKLNVGAEEMTLRIDAINTLVEDINGQGIDYSDLRRNDRILITMERDGQDDIPVVTRIILLPDASDEYI